MAAAAHVVKRVGYAALLTALLAFPVLAQAQYFPPGTFSRDTVTWYSAQLKAMEEPPLPPVARRRSSEAYRFTWLRTFHAPFAFRLDVLPGGSGSLTVKSASGKGGYAPGHLVLNRQVRLDAAQVRRFAAAVGALQFWGLPPTDPSVMVLDGAQWIFEGVKAGRYHAVDRASPERGPYKALMLELVALSGITVEPVY